MDDKNAAPASQPAKENDFSADIPASSAEDAAVHAADEQERPSSGASDATFEDELRAAYEELEVARRKLEEIKAKHPASDAAAQESAKAEPAAMPEGFRPYEPGQTGASGEVAAQGVSQSAASGGDVFAGASGGPFPGGARPVGAPVPPSGAQQRATQASSYCSAAGQGAPWQPEGQPARSDARSGAGASQGGTTQAGSWAAYGAPQQPGAQTAQQQGAWQAQASAQTGWQQPSGSAQAWDAGAQRQEGWQAASQGAPQQPYGGAAYSGYQQPYYRQPMVRTKDHVAAGLLGIFLGVFGIHKFYLGYNTAGFIMLAVTVVGSLFTLGLAAGVITLIGIIEGIIYLVKSQTDFEQLYVFNKREWF